MAFPTTPAILTQRDLAAAELGTNEVRLRLYAWMYYSRTTDNRILDLFRQGLIKGTVAGGQGNEGLIVPLALLADKASDVVSFTHRDLGGHLIWSGHLCDHLNQYFANAGSPTKAREGNVHRGDPANRSYPMISHLGAMLSNVLGGTDSQRRKDVPAVGFAIFGDGGSSTGDIHECLNLASILSLPVIFLIENNRYAYSTPISEQFAPETELWQRAAGYRMEGRKLDATDPEGIAKELATILADVRAKPRPMLIEVNTLRLRGHAAYDTCDYLKPGEQTAFEAADPLPKLRETLKQAGLGDDIAALEKELYAYIESCIQVSIAYPRPDPTSLIDSVYAPDTGPMAWKAEPAEPQTLNHAQALNLALDKILTERPESLILGQDIATYGGAFKVTDGLLDKHGRSRVFNTPLAESACTGYATGLALNGHRPIEEFQFSDFSTEAVTQIGLNAATYRFRSGAKVPVVYRFPCGGGLTFGSFHSQELESLFLSLPGIKALYPSTPQDAFNAMLAAYEDDNPVILFEHKSLYRRGKAPVAFDPSYRDVWQPRYVREGNHATLITYGEMVHLAEEAAAYLADEYDFTLDIWDLRALSPLKLDTIRASVARTHRLIILHEGRRTHGFGAELVARLTEENFFDLESAPLRITAQDMPVPFAPELEQAYRPTRDSIIAKIADWIG